MPRLVTRRISVTRALDLRPGGGYRRFRAAAPLEGGARFRQRRRAGHPGLYHRYDDTQHKVPAYFQPQLQERNTPRGRRSPPSLSPFGTLYQLSVCSRRPM